MGGNLPSEVGEPLDTLRAAVVALSEAGVDIRAASRVFETPCFPAGAGPDYLNATLEVVISEASADFLQRLHAVERMFGRVRETRWAGRTLDLDLLAVETEVAPIKGVLLEWIELPLSEQSVRPPAELILPHPRLQDRAFMLIPFCDLAPDWRHPVFGKTVTEMCALRPEAEKIGVKALEGVEILPE